MTVNNTGTIPNRAPIADLLAPETSPAGELIVLDGSNSYDPDSDPLAYSWTLVDRPKGKNQSGFSDSGEETTTMTPLKAGTYVVRLTVSDGSASNWAEAIIDVTGSGGDGPKPCRGGPKKCP